MVGLVLFIIFYIISTTFCWHQMRNDYIKNSTKPSFMDLIFTLFPCVNFVFGLGLMHDNSNHSEFLNKIFKLNK